MIKHSFTSPRKLFGVRLVFQQLSQQRKRPGLQTGTFTPLITPFLCSLSEELVVLREDNDTSTIGHGVMDGDLQRSKPNT